MTQMAKNQKLIHSGYNTHMEPNPDDPKSSDSLVHVTNHRLTEKLLFSALLLITGVVMMTQIRQGISMQEKFTSANKEFAIYQQQLSDLADQNKQLKTDYQLLAEQKDALTESVLQEQGYSELAISLSDARMLAGLSSVSGEGITITMNDSTITDTTDINQLSLIHSQDVQYVLDLLKSAGAQAIDINGERIVFTTSITCTGPTIRVNNSRYPVPFVISAICDPESTYDILQNDSYLQYRKDSSVEIDFVINRSLTIPAFSDIVIICTDSC